LRRLALLLENFLLGGPHFDVRPFPEIEGEGCEREHQYERDYPEGLIVPAREILIRQEHELRELKDPKHAQEDEDQEQNNAYALHEKHLPVSPTACSIQDRSAFFGRL
jgi:hypothetical protein